MKKFFEEEPIYTYPKSAIDRMNFKKLELEYEGKVLRMQLKQACDLLRQAQARLESGAEVDRQGMNAIRVTATSISIRSFLQCFPEDTGL